MRICKIKLRDIDFPDTLRYCCDGMCENYDPCEIIDDMYYNIVPLLLRV